MLTLAEHVLLPRLHQAPEVEVVCQGAVGGAGGALLGDVVEGGEVAATGDALPQAEHVDAYAVVPAAEGGDGGIVLHGPQQGIMVPDGHHDIGKAGGHNLGGEALGAVRRGEAVGAVQLRQLLRRQGAQ